MRLRKLVFYNKNVWGSISNLLVCDLCTVWTKIDFMLMPNYATVIVNIE